MDRQTIVQKNIEHKEHFAVSLFSIVVKQFAFDNCNIIKYKLVEAVDEEWPGALPYTLLVEPGGKVIYRVMGELSPLALKKAIVGKVGRYYP